MKPLVNSGDLVDFKINLIFEKEKDLALESSEKFYKKLKDIYKFQSDNVTLSNLYRKLINYQIKKYGAIISDSDCKYGVFTHDEYCKLATSKHARKKARRNRHL